MNKKLSSSAQALSYVLLVPLVLLLALALTVSADPVGPNTSSASIQVLTREAEPEYYIDAKEALKAGMEALDPTEIDTVQVLKGESATAVFGAKGKNGVVVITTKKNKDAKAVRELNEKIIQAGKSSNESGDAGQVPADVASVLIRGKEQKGPGAQGLVIRKSGSQGGQTLQTGETLILVNGKEVTVEEMEKLDPNAIAAREVLKAKQESKGAEGAPASANRSKSEEKRATLLKEHGAKANRDVIIITTK